MLFLILINPFSKNYNVQIKIQLENKLKDKKFEYLTIVSDSKETFYKKIPEILNNFKNKKIKIIVIGGDGTINNVCNILGNFDTSNISIGIIPTGTSNILAKEFNIPNDFYKQIDIILNSPEREIYLSKINNYFFIFSCGIGFDGIVVKEVEENKDLKKKFGALAYFIKGVKILKNKKLDKFKVKIDDILDFEISSIIINRTQRYGINRKIFKTAYIISDYFVCALFNKVDFKNLFKFFAGLSSNDINFRKAKKIQFFISKKVPVQIDGEHIEIIPELITLSSKKIKFILP